MKSRKFAFFLWLIAALLLGTAFSGCAYVRPQQEPPSPVSASTPSAAAQALPVAPPIPTHVASAAAPTPTPALPTATSISSPTHLSSTATPTPTDLPPTVAPTPQEGIFVLYFYFAPEGCPNCRNMAPVIQRFYEEYGRVASLPADPGAVLVSFKRPPIQLPRREVEFYGVPIYSSGLYSWGNDVDGFKRDTGLTIQIVADPGLPIDTSRHPQTVFYNKQTGVHRVAALGVVSYQNLVSQYEAFREDRMIAQASGPT